MYIDMGLRHTTSLYRRRRRRRRRKRRIITKTTRATERYGEDEDEEEEEEGGESKIRGTPRAVAPLVARDEAVEEAAQPRVVERVGDVGARELPRVRADAELVAARTAGTWWLHGGYMAVTRRSHG